MKRIGCVLTVALLVAFPGGLRAQGETVRTRLEARGLPPALVDEVVGLGTEMAQKGVPVEPLADKAIEGWAKHAPPARIAAVLRDFAGRLERARVAVQNAGMSDAPGPVIAAAAEGLGRGLNEEQVGQIVSNAQRREVIGPALATAMALAAQGMTHQMAVDIVVEAERRGRGVSEILDMPSMARAMQMQGNTIATIGEQMLKGTGPAGQVDHGNAERGAGMGARPSDVPPGKGRGQGNGPPPEPGT